MGDEIPKAGSFEAINFGGLDVCQDESEDFPEINDFKEIKRGRKLPKINKKDWKPLERDIMGLETSTDGKKEEVLNMTFQVADVKKPLMSVARVVEKGNIIQFGPEAKDNWIRTADGKRTIPLTENGRGSYLMQVDFVGGGKSMITLDSGAEDSVCPKGWADQFGTKVPGKNYVFRDASGNKIAHLGTRKVKVTSPF